MLSPSLVLLVNITIDEIVDNSFDGRVAKGGVRLDCERMRPEARAPEREGDAWRTTG
ncbi:hypothetical protein GCM10023082_35700 [Streptomyces tremellae]|uniref:Uncharacterized protein n=1 Tax=Streptomyces tremellae TaxID=1124239 RepID=A0ABP7FB40_9ACTN